VYEVLGPRPGSLPGFGEICQTTLPDKQKEVLHIPPGHPLIAPDLMPEAIQRHKTL
jgi:hypothetical protein